MIKKKLLRFSRFSLFLFFGAVVFCFNAPQNEDDKMRIIMVGVKNTIQYLNYSPKLIDGKYSREVYKTYFEKVDPAKRYFLSSDMDQFSDYRTKLGEYFGAGDVSFFKLTIDRFHQRLDEIDKMTQDILKGPINLDQEDSIILDVKKRLYPADEAALYKEWERFIKYNILQEIESLSSKEKQGAEKRDSLLAGNKAPAKDSLQFEVLSPEEKKNKATSEVKYLIGNMFKRLKKRKEMDWFSVYINAHTEVFDPHTNYFSPLDREDFDASLSGKIIGIGAQIQEKRGNVYIGPLVVGAPAWKSKELSEGDKLIKVREMPNLDPINVSGMLIEEVVRIIRGKKGTEVTLTLQKKDGMVKDVSLVRDEVSIEDTFAQSIIINTPDHRRYGLISLPSFNVDFNNAKGRNASSDVEKEILKLKKEKVEGIVLDLRNNGGGSLSEVVDMLGLFVKKGPVVQVKNGEDKVQVLRNKSVAPLWTGPLVVMQNEFSASASEIMTGAIQDYKRGIVVGAPHSFGKGTVQTFIPLNRFLNAKEDFGSVKLTIQKFYRISGKSTQLKGVESDVVMETLFTHEEFGEKYSNYALPWDQIAPTEYTSFSQNESAFNAIKEKSAKRLAENKDYQLLLDFALWRESMDKIESIPLSQKSFLELMESRKAHIKQFDALKKVDNALQFHLHEDEIERKKIDEVFSKKSENWVKNLKKDIYLREAVNVLSEM